jgi:hypothetical protein
MKFNETKTDKTRFYALYEKGRLIRKVNKRLTRIKLIYALYEINVNIVYLTLIGINGHYYALIFTYITTSVKWAYIYTKKLNIYLTN